MHFDVNSDHEISHQGICSSPPLAPFYSAQLLTFVQRERDLFAKEQHKRMTALPNESGFHTCKIHGIMMKTEPG